MEADYDKAARESQAKHDVTIRWDVALNKKALARFAFTKDDSSELRLIPGNHFKKAHDSLCLQCFGVCMLQLYLTIAAVVAIDFLPFLLVKMWLLHIISQFHHAAM